MFLRWCQTNGLDSATEITSESLFSFQEHLFLHRKMNGQPLSLSSQHSRLSLIGLWLRWMHRKGHIPDDPTKNLELPRTAYKLPTILTRRQMENVLDQPNVRKFVGIRDRAIMEVLYSTGVRRTELIELKIDDVDGERGVVTIREGKGRRDRTVPIGERALFWLRQYFSVRPGIVQEPDNGFIFLTSTGIPFTPNHLSWLVRKYIRLASIDRRSVPRISSHDGDAYARTRSRYPLYTGNAWSRSFGHDANLYPRFNPKTQASAHSNAPIGPHLRSGNRHGQYDHDYRCRDVQLKRWVRPYKLARLPILSLFRTIAPDTTIPRPEDSSMMTPRALTLAAPIFTPM